MDIMSTHTSSLSIPETAAHFNVSVETIRRWIKARPLKAERVSGHWCVHPDDDPVIAQMQSEINHLRDVSHKRDTQIE